MSGGLDVLTLKEDDVTKMLAAGTHLGAENVNFQMEQYVYKKRVDGTFILHKRYFINLVNYSFLIILFSFLPNLI